MLILQSRSGKSRRRWLTRSLWIGAAVVAAAGWLAWTPALARYHVWKQEHALEQAKTFIAAHDANNAHLALEVAFTVAPQNIDAWRTAAEMLDQVGTPEAVRIHHHITQMMGANFTDQIALINSALRFNDLNTARDELARLPKSRANDPLALGEALSFAMITQNDPVADALLDRLRKTTPDNEDFKVAQAELHLRHPDPRKSAEARATLAAETSNPKYALRVERALMTDAMVRKDLPEARRWVTAMQSDPQATLADHLHAANFALIVDHKPFEDVFAPLAKEGGGDPASVVALTHWVLAQNRAIAADQWLASLPPDIRKSFAVVRVQADVLAQLKDWDRLTPLLEAGAWGRIPPESIQLAMSAHLVGAHSADLQHQIWTQALASANGSLSAYIVLERLTSIWNWSTESETTLWTIARAFPDQTWADEQLFTSYRIGKDTANMRTVMNTLRTADASVSRYQHDWALLSMLVNPSLDWDEPKEIVRKLYEVDPTNPNYATSYAFALAQAGKGPQALAIVNRLSPAEINYSPRSPYLAYVYGLNHMKPEVLRMEKAGQYIDLLPEEKVLFTLAHELEDRRTPLPPKAKPTVQG